MVKWGKLCLCYREQNKTSAVIFTRYWKEVQENTARQEKEKNCELKHMNMKQGKRKRALRWWIDGKKGEFIRKYVNATITSPVNVPMYNCKMKRVLASYLALLLPSSTNLGISLFIRILCL